MGDIQRFETPVDQDGECEVPPGECGCADDGIKVCYFAEHDQYSEGNW